MRVEEHFQALLLYDQIDFLSTAAVEHDADRDFAISIQRNCLEAANGFQRFLRKRGAWATTREGWSDVPRDRPRAPRDPLLREVGLLPERAGAGHALEAIARALRARRVRRLFAGALRAAPRAAELQALGAVALPAHPHPRSPQHRQPLQGAAGDRRRMVRVLVQRLHPGHRILDPPPISSSSISPASRACTSCARTAMGESMRYVRVEALKAQIEEVQAGLRNGQLYAGHGAGAVFPVEEHVALLAIIEKLYHSWSPAARTASRSAPTSRIARWTSCWAGTRPAQSERGARGPAAAGERRAAASVPRRWSFRPPACRSSRPGSPALAADRRPRPRALARLRPELKGSGSSSTAPRRAGDAERHHRAAQPRDRRLDRGNGGAQARQPRARRDPGRRRGARLPLDRDRADRAQRSRHARRSIFREPRPAASWTASWCASATSIPTRSSP
jgi:hypothetical protein